jgi:hypothetical protein
MAVTTSTSPRTGTIKAFGHALGYTITPSCDAARTVLVDGGGVPSQGKSARVVNTCAHCGGRFGMVTHRWWGSKFCKRACKGTYLRELALGRDQIGRWFGFLCVGREVC